MKRFFLSFFLALAFFFGMNAQTTAASMVVPTSTSPSNYVLVPTFNTYNFLKLDTTSGRIWIVQYSLKNDNKEFEVPLNSTYLSYDSTPGRFALYPTQNNWTFLLLDTLIGTVWHVQWAFEADKRFIEQIY